MSIHKAKFLQYCKLTCLGGSEQGECPCEGHKDCELQNHPSFQYYREMAHERIYKHFRNMTPYAKKLMEGYKLPEEENS